MPAIHKDIKRERFFGYVQFSVPLGTIERGPVNSQNVDILLLGTFLFTVKS